MIQQVARIHGVDPIERICEQLDPTKDNLVLLANEYDVESAQRAFKLIYGHTPKNTLILSFDSLNYTMFVKGFECTDHKIKPEYILLAAEAIDEAFDNVLIDVSGINKKHWPIKEIMKHLRRILIAHRKGAYEVVIR